MGLFIHTVSYPKDTSIEEIKKFFGLVTYMGLLKYPSISEYWSRGPMFANQFRQDKRLVTFLSRKDAEEIFFANKKNRKGEEVIKPDIIVKYNRCKQDIDLSD